MRKPIRLIALSILMLGASCISALAQTVVRGTVKDDEGEPVIGAGIVIRGTTQGTTADLDGSFSINCPSDAILEISSIGFVKQIIPVGGRTEILVILEKDNTVLDQVVVVGYGVQKKSVVSASISSITEDALKHQSNNRIDAVLQGMSSGVTVSQSSGAPGASSQVRVRGIGSIHDSAPLYIVDGLAISGGIDYLNPNDIERIEVLKDAASAAVYGARGANGVILVTTKQGKKGAAKVSYDFSYGIQNPWRKPQVLNATEYAIMMNEASLNNGSAPIYDDPYSYGEGTDWVSAVFNKNAPIQKHDVSISGGNDNVSYAVSAGYLSQEGIIGGDYGRSNYDRFTLRESTQINVFDKSSERSFLNSLKVNTSVSYAHINSTGISENTEYGSVLGSAIGMSPLESIYADEATEELYKSLYPDGYPYIIRDSDGRAYTVVDGVKYNEQSNPLAMLNMPGTKYDTNKFIANASAELQIWDGLKFKTSIGADLAFWGNHSYSNPYFLSSKNYKYDTVTETTTYDENGNASTVSKTNYGSSASQEMNQSLLWQVENVLTYDKTIGKHSFSILLGQSALKSSSKNVGASANGLMYGYDTWKISVNNTLGQQKDGDRNGWGSWNSIVYSLASYFARVSYNYDERYMFEATIRRDGSSRFGPNNKWGNFPSASAAWNFAKESFMDFAPWLSLGKLRASYGINGNDSIGNFVYAVYMSSGNNYVFGSGATGTETISIGTKPSGLSNPNVKWEQSIQTDLGIDLGFWDNRLTLTADYYHKKTSGMLLSMPVPSYAGDSAPIGNLGDMVNQGVEIDINYRNSVGDFNYYIGLNATYNDNKLTYLGDDASSLYVSSHKIGQLSRGLVGLPFPYFYGYKVEGIFQNQEEIDSYVGPDGQLIQPNAVPGDVKFKDINGDGAIDPDNDRTYIGKGIPDWTFGINLGFEFRGIDFNMLLQGQVGAQTFNVTRRTDLYYINLPKTILNRWTGEGSTNSYPRFTWDGGSNENYRVSDLWLEDASFLRARNVQLGYTLPQSLTQKVGISRFRLYLQAENLFTLTEYSGCDPEVTGGNSGYGTEYGIDRGVYPQARTFSIGLNINF
ncbi:MAG: SusC/RagA family TonB-linked outer membrane protein [Candidatus Cryptobacteroides sp.]